MKLRMPAEWERQEATWLAWPHHQADWPGKFEPIPWAYVEVIRHITRKQRVRLIVKADDKKLARKMLTRGHADLSKVDFITMETDRSWMRDPGITFVYNGKERVLLNWRFNGWGGKYNNWHRDEKIPKAIEKQLKVRRI
jgi:agmatine deiminase